MMTPKTIAQYFGESDDAVALAAKLNPYIDNLWFWGAAARAYAFQLNKPDAINIVYHPSNKEIESATYQVDGTSVIVSPLDVASSLVESRYAGEGFAVKLSNGGLAITAEAWNLPPETRIRKPLTEEDETSNALLIEELKKFTAEMRQKEMETIAAREHFERLAVEEEVRLQQEEAALAEAAGLDAPTNSEDQIIPEVEVQLALDIPVETK